MTDELISIIIPLYNAENYVDKILPCILGQTYTALEILLVNDGSTDGTLSKCQQYQRQDVRIRVLSQENGGVSAARNRPSRRTATWCAPTMLRLWAAMTSPH